VVTLGGGFTATRGVAIDRGGNIYVADAGANAIKEVPAGCSNSACVVTLGSGFSAPYGVAVDGAGNV
jgi:DNA-binding beta-propeller fold protein YncE